MFTDVKQVYLPYGYDINEIASDEEMIILKNDGQLLKMNGEVVTDSVISIHKGNYIVKA